jgi:hypothetical protein
MKKFKSIFKIPICYNSENTNTQYVMKAENEMPNMLCSNTGFVMEQRSPNTQFVMINAQ